MTAYLRMAGTILLPLALGVVAQIFWSDIHATVGPCVPDLLYQMSDWVAIIAIFVAIAPISCGAFPPTNIWSRSIYLVGVGMFFISLLANDNSGNIILEVALTTTTLMSLFTVKSEPMSRSIKVWEKTFDRVTVAVVVTALFVMAWPSNPEMEMEWSGWPWVARIGGVMLYFIIAAAQRGWWQNHMKWFFRLHAVANIILAASTLGEFNLTGLAVNAALAVMMIQALHDNDDKE